MATPREIRRLAFQALYQLDARAGGGEDAEAVLSGLMDDPEESVRFTPAEIKRAFLLASQAYADRAAADAFMGEAAPGWPAHRQAAVDRAILRLAHHEIFSGQVHPKVAVNEAVELAKVFSTEKSPAFINGLLDKALKKALRERGEPSDDAAGPADEGAPGSAEPAGPGELPGA